MQLCTLRFLVTVCSRDPDCNSIFCAPFNLALCCLNIIIKVGVISLGAAVSRPCAYFLVSACDSDSDAAQDCGLSLTHVSFFSPIWMSSTLDNMDLISCC
ncbi:hypothetical protein ATANTOWER_025335 [Ataeniobius toweri]|uniref:Uncharacterized protein n=1 Tax=Ataeniobius toweri TaxID=208326 RepID=A0ABU7B909_9TELE|nr:hypothetical protein [Ataeniobius toweri]